MFPYIKESGYRCDGREEGFLLQYLKPDTILTFKVIAIYVFIPSFIQQVIIEHLLSAVRCPRYCG